MKTRLGLLLAAAAVMSTGCGSTAQPQQDALGGTAAGLGDGLEAPSAMSPDQGGLGEAGTAAAEAEAAGGAPQVGAAGATAGQPSAQGPGAGGTTSVPGSRTSSTGLTAKTIAIGFATANDVGAFASTVGAETEIGNQTQIIQAIVKDVNGRGGIAGRQIVPYFHDSKTADVVANPDSAGEAACVGLTEDHHVFAAVTSVLYGDGAFASCMEKHRTPLVHAGQALRPQRVFAEHDAYLYAPTQPTMEALIPALVQRAQANGYFTGWDAVAGGPGRAPVRVGIFVAGGYKEQFLAVARAALTGRGQVVAATYEGGHSSEQMARDAAAAVLKFREAGVTHVVTNNNGAMLVFPQAAESQRYRPRYLVSTQNQPRNGEENPTLVPPVQLRGALGVGWIPTLDVGSAKDPRVTSTTRTSCERAMRAAGQDTSARNSMYVAFAYCDALEFLVAALRPENVSVAGLRAGAGRLAAVPSASLIGPMSFGGHHSYGASTVRDLAYQSTCSCYAYASTTNHRV